MAYTLMNVAEAAYARTVGSVMPLFESFTVKDHNLAVDVIGEVLSRAQKSGTLTESVSEKIKDHLKNNWGKYALGAGALGAGAYAADQGYLGANANLVANGVQHALGFTSDNEYNLENAKVYTGAGDHKAAGLSYEKGEDFASAANSYDKAGDIGAAARAYEKAGDHYSAGSRYLRDKQFGNAASNYLDGVGKTVEDGVREGREKLTDFLYKIKP